MRLIGYLENGTRHIGAVNDDKLIPLRTAADFYRDTRAALVAPGGTPLRLSDVEQAPPSCRRLHGCSVSASITVHTPTNRNPLRGWICRSSR